MADGTPPVGPKAARGVSPVGHHAAPVEKPFSRFFPAKKGRAAAPTGWGKPVARSGRSAPAMAAQPPRATLKASALQDSHAAAPSAGWVADGAFPSLGIKKGDTVSHIDGVAVHSWNDITRQLNVKKPGSEVRVDVWHNGQRTSATIHIDDREPAKAKVEPSAKPTAFQVFEGKRKALEVMEAKYVRCRRYYDAITSSPDPDPSIERARKQLMAADGRQLGLKGASVDQVKAEMTKLKEQLDSGDAAVQLAYDAAFKSGSGSAAPANDSSTRG